MEFLYAIALAAAVGVPVPGPTGVELERLIDTTVQLPGTTDPISWDGPPPVPCGRGVAFGANEVTALTGWWYYISPDGVEVLVDEDTSIPDVAGTFEEVASVDCIGNDRLAFLGYRGTVPSVPVSAYDWRPGGQIDLLQAGGVTIDGRAIDDFVQVGGNQFGLGLQGRLTFPGIGEALVVKRFGLAPIFVTDEQIVLPGRSDPVTGFTAPHLWGQDLVFRALVVGDRGLYRWSQGTGFSVIADDLTPVPGGAGTFFSIGRYAILSSGVAFTAAYSAGTGIFLYDHNGGLAPLVVPGDLTANGETITEAFTPSGQSILFSFTGVTAETAPLPSVFVRTADGVVHRILGVQDQIEGKTVLLVDAGADQDSVAVRVTTTDLEEIIYQATFASPLTIPTLTPEWMAALAFLLAAAGVLTLGRPR